MHSARLPLLIEEMKAEGFDAIALNPGPSFFYLTGISFHLMERPIVVLFTGDNIPTLILPAFERSKAEASDLEFQLFTYDEDEASRARAFHDASAKLGLDDRVVGVEPLRMRVFELRLLESSAPKASFRSAEAILSKLRMVKDRHEIKSMRRAVLVAESALKATIPLIHIGMTEIELAAELVVQLLRAGSEAEIPFSPIVATGPNSAISHATPSERQLQAGDLLVLDWGATVDGYVSDITRTFAINQIDDDLAKTYQVVEQANLAGREAVLPGVSCGQIDRAARAVIESHGYGEFFLHRTGHGLGLEAHEGPYIRQDNDRDLVPGMTFTVEPGIYLPDRGGVRIEDDVVVTTEGGESMTSYSRSLEVLAL